ncbi:MAG: IclR family transcriptional regulator [Burkholderiaceae bacterium]|nr:IclR family transcriptional regulator [Burkholderiaceae bacterium]
MTSNTSASLPSKQRGIQSMEVGGQLLLALAQHGRPMALKDLARDAGMAPAKAHPYLVSFNKLGLIVQDEISGHYGLGPLAMQLGLISLQQFDPVRLASPLLADLAQTLGHTVALAVWGNRGPTIVRIEESPSLVHVTMRHGTVMSLRNTASGRLFAAYLPRDTVLAALSEEQAYEVRTLAQVVPSVPSPVGIDPAFQKLLADVRLHGLSDAVNLIVPGVSALAAPVFDESGKLVLSLTAIGPSAQFDVSLNGSIATALKNLAKDLSQRLGYRLES